MPQTRRERLHEATRTEIKQIARRHMAAEGNAAISLRAIAREMGMAAPSLYRYYASRDDLITALIVDAYNALGDAVQGAEAARRPDDYTGRFLAASLAYRDWALANPADYTLIFGTPIPGYHAPPEVTVPVVRRALGSFAAIMDAAWRAGALRLAPEEPGLSPELRQRLAAWGESQELAMAPEALRFILIGWTTLQGIVSLELFGHFTLIVGDAGELYRMELRALLNRIGLPLSD